MIEQRELESTIHHYLIRGLIDDGFAPDIGRLQELVGAEAASVREALERLEASHGIVCHPDCAAPWVIHPFSLSPAATWVQTSQRGWWAPCIWCALGVATLVGGSVVIHSRIGGEEEDLDLHVCDGFVREDSIVTHFAMPLRSAWDNVHHYCATVLPFRSEADVDVWSRRRKWSIAQASEIFERVGLTGSFWALEPDAGGKPF